MPQKMFPVPLLPTPGFHGTLCIALSKTKKFLAIFKVTLGISRVMMQQLRSPGSLSIDALSTHTYVHAHTHTHNYQLFWEL